MRTNLFIKTSSHVSLLDVWQIALHRRIAYIPKRSSFTDRKTCMKTYFCVTTTTPSMPMPLLNLEEEQQQLLESVSYSSSSDRTDEDPSNTLTPSNCLKLMRQSREDMHAFHLATLAQAHIDEEVLAAAPANAIGNLCQALCHCSFGHSCYWSR